MKQTQTQKQKVGNIGEDVACRFLVKQGYGILDRNYWKKCGEIDIVAERNNVLCFVEVKTVSCETFDTMGDHMPEENVHYWKRRRLSNVIQIYLSEKGYMCNEDKEWQVDVMAVFLDFNTKKAKVRVTENIIL